MNSEIKNRFLELKVTGQRFAISSDEKLEKDKQLIQYLKSVLDNKNVTDFEDIGFCYWNLSDNYGFLRDGQSLYENHKKFYQHIGENYEYLYWTVCDGTQRLTLENSGYRDFWWSLYREAISENLYCSECVAEFHAHRAALYVNPHCKHKSEDLLFAINAFDSFVDKTKHTSEYDFYYLIYLSLISRFTEISKPKLIDLCCTQFNGILQSETPNNYITGEWKSFVMPFSKHRQAIVGLNTAINAFLYMGESATAQNLYSKARELGMPRNHYIESLL